MSSSFTYPTFTHTFVNADGTPASGSIEFTLSKAITNGSVTIVAETHVSAALSSAGTIQQTLVSTSDPATAPQDALWRADVRVRGMDDDTFLFDAPSGNVTVDLGQFMPAATTVG